jgi:hypothetical protein
MADERMAVKSITALSLLAGMAWACARSPESPGQALLGRMRRLAQAPALTLGLVQDTLEVSFKKDEEASHAMVTFYAGTPRSGSRFQGLIELVDCRVPTAQNTALAEPFVVVELRDAGGAPVAGPGRPAGPLVASDVEARFGLPGSLLPAPPEDPDISASYIYKMGPRALWVSLERQRPDKVRSFSLHPLEDSRRP